MTRPHLDSVPQDVVETAQLLLHPRPMRRGSVSERYIKCSKPGCPCGEDAQARHGPYTSLTRAVAGKTSSRYLSPKQAEKAGQQVQAAHEFRQRLEAYWEACERWADRELEAEPRAEALEKKGSRRRSSKKSARKSKA
jgi:hypothetical protein